MQGISIEKGISHESLKKTDLCEKFRNIPHKCGIVCIKRQKPYQRRINFGR